MKLALLLLLTSGCAVGTKINFQQGIDQTANSAGCYVYLPKRQPPELTLATFETCEQIFEQENLRRNK